MSVMCPLSLSLSLHSPLSAVRALLQSRPPPPRLSLHSPLSAVHALVQSGSLAVWGLGSWPSGSPDGRVVLTAVSRWQH